MKKKLKIIVAFSVLMICMSSCVYSLFPIYTEDTLVYIPELVGKWQAGSDPDDYIIIEKMKEEEEESIFASNGDDPEYTDSLEGDGWKVKLNGPISINVGGKEITDRDSVWSYYDKVFSTIKSSDSKKTKKSTVKSDEKALSKDTSESWKPLIEGVSETMGEVLEAVEKKAAKLKGTAYVTRDESYKMVVIDDGERSVYQVHLVAIGEDYFMDLYPLPDFSNSNFQSNLFPVHTFMKVSLEDSQMKLTMFDLDKLNDLFESNLIRLRHEIVDGTVLITAEPKEIQKFLDKYSNDESVFESVESYARVSQ